MGETEKVINPNWGGKRKGSGRKKFDASLSDKTAGIAFRTTPEIKKTLVDEATKNRMTIGEYILANMPILTKSQ